MVLEAEGVGSGHSERWKDANEEDIISSCEGWYLLITAFCIRSKTPLCVHEEKPPRKCPE